MNRLAIRVNLRLLFIAFFVAVLASQFALAQETRKVVASYSIGETLLNLIIEQKKYEGASPAELEGIRMGFEASREENQIGVTLYGDGTLTMVTGGASFSVPYKIQGTRLLAENTNTKQYHELGIFSKGNAVLTVNKSIILDRRD